MSHRNEGSDGASSANRGTTMTLGALLLRILGEMNALATEDGPPPGAIVTARAIGPTPGEGDTRHVIIFLGGGGGFSSFGDFATSDGDFEQILARLAQLHQPQGPPPATKAALDALPMVPIDADDLAESPQCTICCESFSLGAEVCQLPCNHFFDRMCVMEWLTKHNTCPICRYELPVDDAEREQSRKERMAARGIDEDAFFAAHAHANNAHPHSTRLTKRKRKDRSLGAEEFSSVTAEDAEEEEEEVLVGIDSADDREPPTQRTKKRTTARGEKGKERADEPLEDEDEKEDEKQRKRKSKHHKWASGDDVIEREGKRERKSKRSRRDAKRGEAEQHDEEHGDAALDEGSAVGERSSDERSEKAADKNKKKLRKEEKRKAKEEKKNAKKSSGSSSKDDDGSEQERAEPVSSRMPRFFRRFLQRTRHEPL